MWKWFKSGAQEAPPALEKKTRIPAALKAKFARAVFAGECRTLAFPSGRDDGATVYFVAKAADNTYARWTIQKAVQKAATDGGETPVTLKTVFEKLDFFDAVEQLAKFETGHPALNGVEPLGTKADLGRLHFEKLALAEGIVFDTDGLPHPTEDGRILTDGEFSPEMLRHASQIGDRSDFAAGWQKTVIDRIAAGVAGGSTFEGLMSARMEAVLLREFLSNIQFAFILITVHANPNMAPGKHYLHFKKLAALTGTDPQKLKPFADYDGDIRIGRSEGIDYRLHVGAQALNSVEESGADVKNVVKPLRALLALLRALHALILEKNRLAHRNRREMDNGEYVSELKKFRETVKTEAKAMGLSSGDADRFASCVFSEAPIAMPPEIQALIDKGWRLADQAEKRRLQKEAAVFRNEQETPPPAAPEEKEKKKKTLWGLFP